MKLQIVNGNIITGDGKTILERASVRIENGVIVDTPKLQYLYDYTADKVIDAEGRYIIPGVINHHAHGLSFGPFLPSGGSPLPRRRVVDHLNRHLPQGTTTLLNCDGFATMDEVEIVNKLHPVNLKTGTTHTLANFRAADMCDGKGLLEKHRGMTVEEMLSLGAVAIAEVGAGATLGGGVMDYYYIPKAVKQKVKRDITEPQARSLKEAVLGRYITSSAYDSTKVSVVLEQIGLSDVLTPEEARKVVEETVLPPFDTALEGFEEAGQLSKRLGVPMVVHNAAACKEAVFKLGQELGSKLIAGHSNHVSFEPDEAVEQAKRLRSLEVNVDIYSMLEKHVSLSETTVRMFETGLVDLISTDFIGGYWDSILLFIEKAVEAGVVQLPKACAMATSNVARAIPKLALNRGFVAPGKIADIVVVDKDRISKVHTVIIGGKVVVEDGTIRSQYLNPPLI